MVINPEDETILSEALSFAKKLEVPATALIVEQNKIVPAGPVSSIGGAPSMPRSAAWPSCKDQRPMVFLAQINFAEMPPLHSFPGQGIIQFFVKDDDVFGVFTGEFQVLYHTNLDTLERRSAPTINFTPFGHRLHSEGAILKGSPAAGLPNFGCWQVDEYIEKLEERTDVSDEAFDALERAFDEARPSTHYFGGHPAFDQGDVRRSDERDLSAVLFQMGYQPDDNGWDVCWGDAGQATFLTTENDLLQKDFTKILYNWDCA
ncbi:MAG: DUF1963 domain-containing protein [Tateyamaria sp.]|uniref:YwqG family protein n=1 Tax=Tateyamaria sp. TaxID=1929288 RepID=UPI00329AC836